MWLLDSSKWSWSRLVLVAGLIIVAPKTAPGQSGAQVPSPEPIRIGKGVTPPRLIHKVEPEYSREASDAGIQGYIILELAVNEKGVPVNIQILSPLGFGLDERALRAVEQWRFEPGRKDGQPVSILASVEVSFRLIGELFDSKAEGRRTKFNLAVRGLDDKAGTRREGSIKTIRELAQTGFPPAMYALGTLIQLGDGVDRDPKQAEEWIRKAADKNYGPAVFAIGVAKLESAKQGREKEAALRMINDASILGTYGAQAYLGDASERGVYGPPDLERASRAFRLCATTGHSDCQYRLGRLLLGQQPRRERTLIQGVAWLQLAADQGHPDAILLISKEAANLTSDQSAWVRRMKPQLQQKR